MSEAERGKRAARAGLGRAPLTLALCALFAVRSAAAEPSLSAPPPEAAKVSAPTQSPAVPLFAFVFGAIGLSGLSVAATTGFLALNQKAIAEDHCSPTVQLCDGRGRGANETGRALRNISTASLILGGLGVGLSAYWLLKAPAAPHDGDVALAVVVDNAPPRAVLVAHF